MAEHANAALMRQAFEAFASGDVGALEDVLAEDAYVHEPGRGAVSGDYVGRDRVLGFFAKLYQLTGGTFRAELIDILADDERAVVIERSTARRNGRTLDTRDVLVCDIHDGKVVAVHVFPSDADVENAFWARTDGARAASVRHRSELSDAQLDRLGEVLRDLGATRAFSGTEALCAAIDAGVVSGIADIGSAIEDLEQAGVLREVTKNPPRWAPVEAD